MRTERIVAGVVAGCFALSLAACGGNDPNVTATEHLRDSLKDAHEFDSGYELLGTVTYADGNVTVDAEPWADPWAGAAVYCDWVSTWLYVRDPADSTVTINVPARAGGSDATLQRRGESEDCSEAAYHSQYGV